MREGGGKTKRAAANPWDYVPANRKDKRFNDRGANSPQWVSSASRFAAGPMRKPEAAHLMDWFYEIPPYRWLLPFGGSRTRYEIIGSATTICALARMDVKTAFLGPNATTAWCMLPLNGPSGEALAPKGTVPAGVARGRRAGRGAAPGRSALKRRMYEPSLRARYCSCLR